MSQSYERPRLVVGNWKMQGSLKQNAELLKALLAGLSVSLNASNPVACEVVVCPPYPYLAQAQQLLSATNVAWGAQNVSEHGQGAYTGEVMIEMLADFGCRYVIVGHSERRALYGESSDTVAAKAECAIKSGLTPIICVGETLAEREAGQTEVVVGAQLDAVTARLGIEKIARAVLAYEPVWAIGTGKTATPGQAQEMHAYLRARLALLDSEVAARLLMLYGGSVKPGNAAELFAMPDIDGGLIGGASLVAQDFLQIIAA